MSEGGKGHQDFRDAYVRHGQQNNNNNHPWKNNITRNVLSVVLFIFINVFL